MLVNIEDSKIASEFISFREELVSDERRFFYGTFKWFSNFLCSIWTNLVFNTLINIMCMIVNVQQPMHF